MCLCVGIKYKHCFSLCGPRKGVQGTVFANGTTLFSLASVWNRYFCPFMSLFLLRVSFPSSIIAGVSKLVRRLWNLAISNEIYEIKLHYGVRTLFELWDEIWRLSQHLRFSEGHNLAPIFPWHFSNRINFNLYVFCGRPPLWSSGQSSWLQIRKPGFDSRHYQEKKVVGLERCSTHPREYSW
jgi:hypothetical protein